MHWTSYALPEAEPYSQHKERSTLLSYVAHLGLSRYLEYKLRQTNEIDFQRAGDFILECALHDPYSPHPDRGSSKPALGVVRVLQRCGSNIEQAFFASPDLNELLRRALHDIQAMEEQKLKLHPQQGQEKDQIASLGQGNDQCSPTILSLDSSADTYHHLDDSDAIHELPPVLAKYLERQGDVRDLLHRIRTSIIRIVRV